MYELLNKNDNEIFSIYKQICLKNYLLFKLKLFYFYVKMQNKII